jgi:glucan-binding YG repeat protein
MKTFKLTKVIASALVVASVLVLNPTGASAAWKEDNQGWWYTEGESYSVGWKQIDGKWYYFDSNGYIKTGWVQDGAKWYYLNASGDMADDTIISNNTSSKPSCH